MNILSGWIYAFTVIALICLSIIISSILLKVNSPFVLDGNLDNREKSFLKLFFYKYILWGLLQQSILIALYYYLSFLKVPYAEFISVYVFSIIHMPNFVLMLSTFGLGYVSINHFIEYKNILAIGVMHGMIATVLSFYIPKVIITKFTIWNWYIQEQVKINQGKKYE